MYTIAYYNGAKWHRTSTNFFNTLYALLVPLECRLVEYEHAEIIFINYMGNADHIPFITQLLESYPQKKFIFLIGENLHRAISIIPQKITTKATIKKWARIIFPYVYLPSTLLFYYPQRSADKALFSMLRTHKNNSSIFCITTQNGEIITDRTYAFPIFSREMVKHALAEKKLFHDTESKRYSAVKNTLLNMKSHIFKDATHTLQRPLLTSAIFSNTTKERVMACEKFSAKVYGANPLGGYNKLTTSTQTIYNDSTFVLCLENSSYPGYITEKLSNVLRSAAIPIYWGASNIDEYCNVKSLYHCNTISDIKRLSRDALFHDSTHIPSTFIEKAEQPYFLERHVDFLMNQYETMRYKLLQFVSA